MRRRNSGKKEYLGARCVGAVNGLSSLELARTMRGLKGEPTVKEVGSKTTPCRSAQLGRAYDSRMDAVGVPKSSGVVCSRDGKGRCWK